MGIGLSFFEAIRRSLPPCALASSLFPLPSSLLLLLSLSLFPLPCSLLHAGVVDFKGAVINYTGASTNWVDGDIVFTFADTNQIGKLELPSYATAWILSVGGGGAGGTVALNGSGHGAGGGGGAGGFVEYPGKILSGGTYTITVGAGGLPGTKTAATIAPGGDGNPSMIKLNGVELTDYTALGGGGGGAESAGHGNETDGKKLASGGGGSLSGTTTFAGGAGTSGQGSAGGEGKHYNAAGGGGGAGGDGNSTTSTSGGGSGNGGLGKPSSITGKEIYYAGGGGGGIASGTVAKGGGNATDKGGGGNGAGGLSGTKTPVESGVDGFGGGGGGGNHKQIGGNGGSGVVIIRISEALAGDPDKPDPPTEPFRYRPEGWMVVTNSLAYKTLTGGCATNVGPYHCKVELKDGFKWSDGTETPVKFDWEIKPQLIDKPTDGETFPYDGEMKFAIPAPHPGLKFTDLEAGGKTNEVNAGEYHYTVEPKDANYAWAGEEKDHERDPFTVNWSITPKPIKPPAKPDLRYNRGNQVAVTNEINEAWVFTDLESGGVTNATLGGNYHYTVGLKNNNYVWEGAEEGHERDPIRIDWSIKPMRITPPVLYEDLVFNNTLQDAFNTDTLVEDACEFTGKSVYSAKDAGGYQFTLTLKNGETDNFVWWKDETETFDDLVFDWSIAIAPNEVRNLKLDGWKVGSTPNTPTCETDWGMPVYAYAISPDAAEEDWKSEPPDEPGTWYCRATVAKTENWTGASAMVSFALWDNPDAIFTDHVTITVRNESGKDYSAYPLTLKFAENSPVGFSYERAGATGEDLIFVSGDGLLQLPYKVEGDWNPAGESQVTVYLKTLPKEGTTIDLYWHLRPGQERPAQPSLPTSPSVPSDKVKPSYGTVERDGLKVDSWAVEPALKLTTWNVKTPPASLDALTNNYALASGAAVSTGFFSIYDPSVTNALVDALSAPTGVYRAFFANDVRDDWEPIAKEILFVVSEQLPRSGIAGNKGDSGRVLLMNNDGSSDELAIDYQGWWDRVDRDPTLVSQTTFWEFLGEDDFKTDSSYNLKTGTNCVLWTANRGRRLWQLVDCRHGNTYGTGDTKASPTLDKTQNYLPWSSKSRRITAHNTFSARAAEVGQVVMRNALGAAVYSPVYSNDVGTIYFDAVNGWKTVDDGKGGENYYQIVVEASTNLVEVATEVPEGDWSPLTMYPVHVKGDALTAPAAGVTRFGLDITTDTGATGAKDEFYRIYVPVPEELGRRPMRFRIRRASIHPEYGPDGRALLLLDNILVSYPAQGAHLKSAGFLDPAKRGAQVLGWEAATKTPAFPSMNDGNILTRAVAETYVNDLDPTADPSKFIVAASLHYRWRYLTQSVDAWEAQAPIDLNPIAGDFTALAPLKLPGRTGDVEYWFEAHIQAPFYKYTDYSGQNLADKFAEIYSEEVTETHDALSPDELERLRAACGGALPSAGADWFFRLREGASDNETVRIVAERPSGEEWEPFGSADLEIVGNGSWRGFLKTPDAVEGGLRFRLETVTLAEPAPGSFAFTTNRWRTVEDFADLPKTMRLEACGASDGRLVPCDGTTGYLAFQYEERTASLTAARADYQNFNMWSAAAAIEKFVGSSVDTNYVSSTVGESNVNWSAWALSVATNADWTQTFSVDKGVRADARYPKNKPFSSALAGGWLVENAMWTYGKWTHETWSDDWTHITTFGDDSAAQLEGRGKGRLSFVSATSAPKGLDSVFSTLRLAQYNGFNDFYYWNKLEIDWDARKVVPADEMTNYTFVAYANLSETGGNDFSGDGTISLAGYYTVENGCYEARFSRGSKDTNVRIRLLRWHSDGLQMTCEDLGFKEVDDRASAFLGATSAKSGGLFLSVEECPLGTFTGQTKPATLVQAGFLRDPLGYSIAGPGDLSGKAYVTVSFRDESALRLTRGTFGLLTANCNAVLRKPAYYDRGLGFTAAPPAGELTLEANRTATFLGNLHYDFSGTTYEKYYGWWTKPPRRLDPITDMLGMVGFRSAVPAPVKLEVQIASHGGSDWTAVATNTVTSFADVTLQNVIHSALECDVRFVVLGQPDDVRTDVVVNGVSLTQWRGQETPGLDASGEYGRYREFVYTGGWIDERNPGAKDPGRVLSLQPARAYSAGSPISLRAPLLSGVGLIHFAWRNADAHCKLHLQVSEMEQEYPDENPFNLLRARLVNLTRAAPDDGEWTTLRTWDFSKMDAATRANCATGVTVYVNHRAPTAGVLRLVIDRATVEDAIRNPASKENPFYGGLQLTDAYVWDMPAYDARCWSGWNMRVTGWQDSAPGGFANIADAPKGYSCILNNTLDASTLADSRPEHYRQNLPYVQTPTFLTNCIGEVVFKARVHDVPRKGNPSVVTVYGANRLDETSHEPTDWEEVGEVVVEATTYQTYSLKFKASASYRALRFAVKGVDGVIGKGVPLYDPPARVAIDSVCVLEQAQPSVRFRNLHVRPFRDATAMKALTAVPEEILLSPDGQPLLGETFGFQAELELQINEEGDIRTDDPRHPITVELAYYVGEEPWGYERWKDSASAVKVQLVAAAGTNLIFRSTLDRDRSVVPPVLRKDLAKPYGVVQYHMTARYYDRAGDQLVHELSAKDWSMPSWYAGMPDPNAAAGAKFAAFTVLDEISPGRAWINEVNYVEDGKAASLAGQWIELAVPSEVDMTDWSIDAYNKSGELIATMVTLGRKGAPAKKAYSADDPVGASSHYAFYTIKSPNAVMDAKDYDWVWTAFNGNGSLSYAEPYGFALKRPSGIVEHRVVTQGDAKQHEDYRYYYQYTGTNLVRVLGEKAGGRWVYAGEDPLMTGYGLSVFTGHGAEESDWDVRKLTPSHSNDGQGIPPDWFIPPNGGFVWIYSTVFGDHMRQIIGGETNKSASLTIQQGLSTNIVFEVDRWYKLGTCNVTPSDRTVLSGPVPRDGKNYYTLALNQVSNRIDVVASNDVSDAVTSLLDPRFDAYRPAIMSWLEKGVTGNGPFANPDGPLTNGYYRGHVPSSPLPDGPDNVMDLAHLYWLDLDPTAPGWELWGGMGAKPGSAGSLPVDETVLRSRTAAGGKTIVHTNHVTSVWLELKNEGLGLDYPPYRLQGLANEQSDTYGGSWTSVNFKVTMCLNNGKVDWVFQPMRFFVFGPGSFCGADDPDTPFAAQIEIVDPFSDQSPASEWGWKKYESEEMRENGLFTRWRIGGGVTPDGVSTLKKDDSLEF